MGLKKLKTEKGFTLTEMLIAVAILSLLSALLVTGTRLAVKSYAEVTDESNAQVLLSTCATMLRNELSNARDVELSEDGVLSYKKGESSTITTLKMSGGQITVSELGVETPLVSDVTATNELCPCFESIEYADSQFRIHELAVKKKGESRVLSSIDLLVINHK